MEGKIIHNGEPLDFSHLKLKDIFVLRKERPRGGKRKAVEKEEDEEDNKKETLNQALEENADEKKDEKVFETKVTKAQHTPQISDLLHKNYTSLQNTKNMIGGRKVDDGKEELKRTKEIAYDVNSLFLDNNEIRDIRGLSETLMFVLPRSNP